MVEALGMRSTVLGGGGFLGQHITRMLLARGEAVRIFNRGAYPALVALGATGCQGDILDYEAVRAACEGSDTVFHTVAVCDIVRSRRRYYEVNVRGTAHVIRACLETGVRHLVYTSTPSVVVGQEDIIGGDESLPYPSRYTAPYPATKAVAEQMVLAANCWEMVVGGVGESRTGSGLAHLRTCALRPHLIWGPGDPHIIPKLFQGALQGRLRMVGDGRNQVSLTYVENAAHGHIQAADELRGQGRCAGRAYFINDTAPVLLWEWINALLVSLGLPPVTRRVSHPLARALSQLGELAYAALPFLGTPRMTRFVVDQLARSHCFSHAAATRDFGYVPLVTPEEGMRQLLDWGREMARDQAASG